MRPFRPRLPITQLRPGFLNNARPFSSQAKVPASPLEGIRILDLTRVLAGPYCTMILGDLGAEVIKLEHPDTGDDTRRWGPPFLDPKDKDGGGDEKQEKQSAYFLSINRNKKSVCVNIKNERGRQVLQDLAQKSDVLVENYVPGQLSQYGLGYSHLSKDNPQLIYCSITGFGSDGPYAKRPGYDVIAASLGGMMHITGPSDGAPCKTGVALTDLCTGLYAHGAIMAALLQRQKTGLGQLIECDLLSTCVSTLTHLAANYLNAGVEPQRHGSAHASIVPYESLETRDGFMTIGCGNDRQFVELCWKLGEPELADDPRYATNEMRVKNRADLLPAIRARLKQKTIADWNSIFANASFPHGPVNTFDQVFADPQVQHANLVRDVEHETLGPIRLVGPAVKYSGLKNDVRSGPPPLAANTDEVLRGVAGYGDEQLRELRDCGAIR